LPKNEFRKRFPEPFKNCFTLEQALIVVIPFTLEGPEASWPLDLWAETFEDSVPNLLCELTIPKDMLYCFTISFTKYTPKGAQEPSLLEVFAN